MAEPLLDEMIWRMDNPSSEIRFRETAGLLRTSVVVIAESTSRAFKIVLILLGCLLCFDE
jgi:hypothetical protein